MDEIEFRGVRKTFDKTTVVQGVDLTIPKGAFVVVLGPSGCGKSTLLRMVAGLEDITEGEISLAGQVVNKLEPRERGCAMVFQNYALYPHMTVAENIGYALKVAGVPKAERERRIAAVASSLGLSEYVARRPAQLSGGQRQRVAMGRAMIREPKVFLFDEPLSNLDAKLRVQMRIEIRKLHNRLGATSVFVTHDQVEALTLADIIVVMNAGRIEQVGTPAEVYGRPASRFVAGFIGSPPMNLLDGAVSGPNAVATPAGTLIVQQGGLQAGRGITVGIRAEDVVIAAAGMPAIDFDVDFSEELGPSRLLHGALGGEPFVVQVPSSHPLSRGRIGVTIPPASLHLFDRDTTRRIEDGTTVAAAA